MIKNDFWIDEKTSSVIIAFVTVLFLLELIVVLNYSLTTIIYKNIIGTAYIKNRHNFVHEAAQRGTGRGVDKAIAHRKLSGWPHNRFVA